MSLFSRITKSSDKSPYPWSQRKLSGGTSSNAVPRFGHAATALQTEQLLIYGGYHKSPNKKDLFIVDTGKYILIRLLFSPSLFFCLDNFISIGTYIYVAKNNVKHREYLCQYPECIGRHPSSTKLCHCRISRSPCPT